ncbi:MAG: hypothetical protein NXI24_20440 [bacterium]|nr:hypothetical protein [bacterium]
MRDQSQDSFLAAWRLLLPLRGATRFFSEPQNAVRLATPLLQFLLMLAACAGLMIAFDWIALWMTADFRAAAARVAPTPYADPLLPSPYSEIVSALAFVAIWLIYVAVFAALRSAGARLWLPAKAQNHDQVQNQNETPANFRRQLIYAIFAAAPIVLTAVFAKGLSLIALPVDPTRLSPPTPMLAWLPPILFVLSIFTEAWIVSRAMTVRHAANGVRAFAVWAAPLLFWSGIFALYLFLFAVWNYPA